MQPEGAIKKLTSSYKDGNLSDIRQCKNYEKRENQWGMVFSEAILRNTDGQEKWIEKEKRLRQASVPLPWMLISLPEINKKKKKKSDLPLSMLSI